MSYPGTILGPAKPDFMGSWVLFAALAFRMASREDFRDTVQELDIHPSQALRDCRAVPQARPILLGWSARTASIR